MEQPQMKLIVIGQNDLETICMRVPVALTEVPAAHAYEEYYLTTKRAGETPVSYSDYLVTAHGAQYADDEIEEWQLPNTYGFDAMLDVGR